MAIKHHSFKAVCFAILSGLYLFAGITVVSAAETGALEQLLELFEKKGAITREEAGKIRLTIQQDRKQLEEKETAIQEQERALVKREKELAEKEKALQIKEQALLQEQTSSEPEKPMKKMRKRHSSRRLLKALPPRQTKSAPVLLSRQNSTTASA